MSLQPWRVAIAAAPSMVVLFSSGMSRVRFLRGGTSAEVRVAADKSGTPCTQSLLDAEAETGGPVGALTPNISDVLLIFL